MPIYNLCDHQWAYIGNAWKVIGEKKVAKFVCPKCGLYKEVKVPK